MLNADIDEVLFDETGKVIMINNCRFAVWNLKKLRN
jgi:hypothetical protein